MSDQLFEERTDLAVRFDGRTLRRGDDNSEVATLHEDGQWRTPDGAVTHGLDLPQPNFSAAVSKSARAQRNREVDAAWLSAAEQTLAQVARDLAEFTTDEVWERLEHPPREGRQIGALMTNGERAKLIEQSSVHRPSTRPNAHRRPVLVWRSLVYQPPLG